MIRIDLNSASYLLSDNIVIIGGTAEQKVLRHLVVQDHGLAALGLVAIRLGGRTYIHSLDGKPFKVGAEEMLGCVISQGESVELMVSHTKITIDHEKEVRPLTPSDREPSASSRRTVEQQPQFSQQSVSSARIVEQDPQSTQHALSHSVHNKSGQSAADYMIGDCTKGAYRLTVTSQGGSWVMWLGAGNQAIFGRGPDSEVRVMEPFISNKHGLFEHVGSELFVSPLALLSVNGEAIRGRTPLRCGSVVSVGSVQIVVGDRLKKK